MDNKQRDFIEALTRGVIDGLGIGLLSGAAGLLVYVIIATR